MEILLICWMNQLERPCWTLSRQSCNFILLFISSKKFCWSIYAFRVHENPLPFEDAKAKMATECKCLLNCELVLSYYYALFKGNRYCWGNPGAPWLKHIPAIRAAIRNAVKAYVDTYRRSYAFMNPTMKDVTVYTTVDETTDLTNAPAGTKLPLVPGSRCYQIASWAYTANKLVFCCYTEVVLQYRCGDNIGFSYMYGILPFFAFDDIIPKNARFTRFHISCCKWMFT